MGIGTTIEAVARELIVAHQHLRVITNNIHIASIITRRPDFRGHHHRAWYAPRMAALPAWPPST